MAFKKIAIVEDEEDAVAILENHLAGLNLPIEIIGIAKNGKEAELLLNNPTIDLAFLDIDLGDTDIFKVLEKIKSPSFKIVFVTAFDQYAIKAFQLSALHYLLKPFAQEDISEIFTRLETRNNQNTSDQVHQLIHNLTDHNKPVITISTTEGFEFISVEKIIRLQSDAGYTLFFLEDGKKIIASQNIGHFESILPEEQFFRAHRANLINLKFVSKFKRLFGGTIVMADGSEVELARRRKDDFLHIFSLQSL